MNPATLNSSSFTVYLGTQQLLGAVSYNGLTASFNPSVDLLADRLYTATITSEAQDPSGSALLSNYVWTFTSGDSVSLEAPTVISTLPINGATNVAVTSDVSANFNVAMSPSSIAGSSFVLRRGVSTIAGTVTYTGGPSDSQFAARFSPGANLLPDTLYTATITTGATDLSGTPLANDYVWSFRTAPFNQSGTPPTVSSTVPASAEQDVALNISPMATFSQVMDPATITTSSFTLQQGGTSLLGSVSYTGNSATFNPNADLSPNTLYTATITTGARNLGGTPLAANYVWSFRTGVSADTSAPTVIATVPADGAQDVAFNISPAATFSEAMNPLTLNATSFTLLQGITVVPGTVSSSGANTTFSPLVNLLPDTTYMARITTAAEDLAGNPLASDYVWTFQTGATLDATPPTVISTVPADDAVEVAITVIPMASFSEVMNPLTINNLSFTLEQGLNTVPGAVTYSGVTATFTPLSNLTANTLYTGTISTAAEDLAGNALANDYVWTFRTAVLLDTLEPTVVSTIPADGAVNVPVGVIPSATFSEAMNELTISNLSFTLAQGVTPVLGTVEYTGGTATFTPAVELEFSTLYTATITTGAEDLAGNALQNDYVWTFTTAALPDTLPPTVVSTIPDGGATNVPIGIAPSATFSEQMDDQSINNLTFTLAQGLTPVLGTVNYLGLTATFTPSVELELNTVYTATITTGAEDLAGNALQLDYVWTFTTAVVDLGAAFPFGGFGGGAGMTNQGIFTVVNGDIGTTAASTLITGFHDLDGDIYTETPLTVGFVNGMVFSAPPLPGTAEQFVIASQAAIDAQLAFLAISPANLPGGSDPGAGELGGLTLFPGVYMAAGGTFQITNDDLTLDAQGDPDAVWVFQSASSLTVGDTAPRSIVLINGAQAKNVYWYVGSAATINAAGGGTMVGTIIASAGVTFSTAGNVVLTVLDGRALGLNASVTLVNTVINIPE